MMLYIRIAHMPRALRHIRLYIANKNIKIQKKERKKNTKKRIKSKIQKCLFNMYTYCKYCPLYIIVVQLLKLCSLLLQSRKVIWYMF